MKLRRFLWVLRRKPVATGFNILSVAVAIGAALVTLKVSPAFSYIAGALAVALLVYGLVRFLVPGGDEEVEWNWEKQLLAKAIYAHRVPVLCTRHVLTRAEGRALGCAVAQGAASVAKYVDQLFKVKEGEIHMENDVELADLEEHARHADFLFKAVAAVVKADCIQYLAVIAGGDAGPIGVLARAVREDLQRLPGIVEEHVLQPLDDGIRELREQSGTAQHIRAGAKGVLKQVSAILRLLHKERLNNLCRVTDELYTMMLTVFREDCRTSQSNEACEPVCRELAA